jgi:acyl-CoA synthetase (AMP-forming)/AMP-acid ligase II
MRRSTPNRPAVIAAEDGAVLTYRELDDSSMRLAQLLYGAGLRTGQHIAFLSNNGSRCSVSLGPRCAPACMSPRSIIT